MTYDKKPSCELEKELFEAVDSKTPDYIKNDKLIDLNNKNEFVFTLKKEHLEPYNAETNPEGLNLAEWLESYAKEAEVSTAGIRGPQNILYPHDTRFPINMIGIMLATEAKALAAQEIYPDSKLMKLAGSEVRYNSDKFLELIARIQAAHGIKRLFPKTEQQFPSGWRHFWLSSSIC